MKKRALIAYFFLMIFLLPFCKAIVGVSPAKYDIDFEPNLKQKFYFEFIGDPGVQFEIYPEGDLADYVQLDRDMVTGRGRVQIILSLPSEIEVPGKHRLYITGAQQVNSKEKGFAIVGNVRGVIQINVPFPGKYAEIDFTMKNAKSGEDAPFDLKINNLGKEGINTKSYIEIYDSLGKKVETFYAGDNAISPAKLVEISSTIPTSKYRPGEYTAVAIVEYEGRTAKKDAKFRIGELYVAVSKHSDNFQRGKINRFEIEVESFWNDPIGNVYAEVEILDYNTKFTTPSINLKGFEKSVLTGFFDTTPIEEDSFKAKITIHYGDKTTEEIVNLKFKNEINYTLYIMISTITIFLIIVIFLSVKLIRLERRLNEKERRRK